MIIDNFIGIQCVLSFLPRKRSSMCWKKLLIVCLHGPGNSGSWSPYWPLKEPGDLWFVDVAYQSRALPGKVFVAGTTLGGGALEGASSVAYPVQNLCSDGRWILAIRWIFMEVLRTRLSRRYLPIFWELGSSSAPSYFRLSRSALRSSFASFWSRILDLITMRPYSWSQFACCLGCFASRPIPAFRWLNALSSFVDFLMSSR